MPHGCRFRWEDLPQAQVPDRGIFATPWSAFAAVLPL